MDDAGLRRAALHERRHAVRRRGRRTCPSENPTGVYRRAFSVPPRLAQAPGGAPFRWRRGGAARARERTAASGSSKDARTPAEFDVTGARAPRRAERARRRRRPLVRRELHRGSGSVVARRDLTRRATARDAGTYIADVFARGVLDDGRGRGRLSLAVEIGGDGRRTGSSRRGCSAPAGRDVLERPLERTGERTAGLEHVLRSARAWSAEEPALYTARALARSRAGERARRLPRRLPPRRGARRPPARERRCRS